MRRGREDEGEQADREQDEPGGLGLCGRRAVPHHKLGGAGADQY